MAWVVLAVPAVLPPKVGHASLPSEAYEGQLAWGMGISLPSAKGAPMEQVAPATELPQGWNPNQQAPGMGQPPPPFPLVLAA